MIACDIDGVIALTRKYFLKKDLAEVIEQPALYGKLLTTKLVDDIEPNQEMINCLCGLYQITGEKIIFITKRDSSSSLYTEVWLNRCIGDLFNYEVYYADLSRSKSDYFKKSTKFLIDDSAAELISCLDKLELGILYTLDKDESPLIKLYCSDEKDREKILVTDSASKIFRILTSAIHRLKHTT